MTMKFFTIPAFGGEGAAAELNRFLATHRILGLERQFVQDGANSAWCLCVRYQGPEAGEGAAPAAAKQRGRVDYKEVLSAYEFPLYSHLRDLRKRLAEQEGVPVYTLFTNEQLAAMVQRRIAAAAQLREIEGVGDARIEKYGQAFLAELARARREHPEPPAGQSEA